MRNRILTRSRHALPLNQQRNNALAADFIAAPTPPADSLGRLERWLRGDLAPGIMAMDTTTLRDLIKLGMPDAAVDVAGADGVHFEARVVSAAFNGKLPLARHRMVYATLGERMGGEIHALALRTLTPEEAARDA